MPDPLFVFLVSGRPEGGNPHGTDETFARCAWLRVAELVRIFYKNRKKPGVLVGENTVLRFIHFASHDSTVGIYEHDFATMANRVRDPLAKATAKDLRNHWRPLDSGFQTAFGSLSAQEDPKKFCEWKEVSDAKSNNPQTWGKDDDPPANVSIVNVYHSVRNAPPGSMLELSIFSHAFVDGPVLNNTSANPGATTRTPGDTDGRAAVDFQSNMGESDPASADALDEFRNAFASTGSFRIWGCNIQDLVDTVPPENLFFNAAIRAGGGQVHAAEINNLGTFIAKLSSDTDPSTKPVSQFIWSTINLATKKLLTNPAKPPDQREDALDEALNQILKGNSLFKAARFAGVTLRQETQLLSIQTQTGPHLITFNRLLLEDAYPADIVRIPKRRCLIMSTVRQVVEAGFTRHLKPSDPISKLLRDDKHLPPGNTNITLDMDAEIGNELSLQTDPGAGHGFTPFVRSRLFEIRYDELFSNHSYHAFFQGERTNPTTFAGKITRSLSDIVKFVAAETTGSYFFLAAKGLQPVTVISGAPGTSAELPDGGGQQFIGTARLFEAKFFSKFFDVAITEVEPQRHYAILGQLTVWRA